MKEFLFIYRTDYANMNSNITGTSAANDDKKWMDWMGGIAAQNKLATRGNRLHDCRQKL